MSEELTPHEMRILDLLIEGNSTGEIARILNRSVETVKTHLKSARRKAGAKNSIHLISIAFRNGWVV